MLARGTRRSATQWRGIFEQQHSSGLTQQAYCQREGIAMSTFSRWRQRLVLSASSDCPPNDSAETADFVELTNATAPPLDTGLALRLELGAGVVLELRRTA